MYKCVSAAELTGTCEENLQDLKSHQCEISFLYVFGKITSCSWDSRIVESKKGKKDLWSSSIKLLVSLWIK